ncbi:MAG: type III secretion system export apparatus subunit SctT [Geminicoccaceae bacterium]
MPFLDVFVEVLEPAFDYLIAMSIAMARGTGIAIIMPLFLRTGITGILRSGVVIAISLPLLPYVFAELTRVEAPGMLFVISVVLKEGFIGFLLGIAFGLPFWGIEAAGDVIDFQRGSTGATMVDPSQVSEASVTGTFLVLVMLTLFVVVGGMTIVVDTLYKSYAIWPIFDFTPKLSVQSAVLFFGLLDEVMRLAFVIAGPVIIAMFLGDAILASITRFAPQLNVFVLSMGVKSAIFVALMPIYAVFLVDYLGQALTPTFDVVEQFRRLIR